MSVNGIGSAPSPVPPYSTTRQDLQAVRSALQQGDLEGAQQAFAALKDDFHALHGGRNLMQTHVPTALKQDLQSLQSALNANDLAGAQQAFTTLQQDYASRHAHHPDPLVEPPSPAATQSSGVDFLA